MINFTKSLTNNYMKKLKGSHSFLRIGNFIFAGFSDNRQHFW